MAAKSLIGGLNSYEKLTRYLRDKTGDVTQQLEVGSAVINGGIDAYLPQKEIVVLDWLLDRLEELNGTRWRTNEEAWRLLSLTWSRPVLDNRMKERIVANHNIDLILTRTFEESGDAELDAAATFMSMVTEDQKLFKSGIPEPSSGMIIAFFSSSASKDIKEMFIQVFETKFKHLDSKAYFAHYSSDLIRCILRAMDNDTIRQSNLRQFALRILSNIFLFGSKVNWKSSIANQIYTRADEVLKLIFDAMGATGGLKESNAYAEEIAGIFTAHLSLVLRLSRQHGIKFSNDKLEKYTLALLGSSDDDELNLDATTQRESWITLRYMLDLNAPIVLKHSELLYWKLTESRGSEGERINLAVRLIEVFAQTRQLQSFISKWRDDLSAKELWIAPEIIATIERTIITLTDFQVASILEQCSGDDVILNPLLVGMNKSMSKNFESAVHGKLTNLILEPRTSWQSRYLILSLDRSVITPLVLESITNLKISDDDILDAFEFVFRLREITDIESFSYMTDRLVDRAIHNSEVLSKIAERWYIMINRYLSRPSMITLSQAIVEDESALGKLLARHDFFEQPSFCRCILQCLARSLSTAFNCDYRVSIISMIPSESFSRALRVDILDALTTLDQKLRPIEKTEMQKSKRKGHHEKKRPRNEIGADSLLDIRKAILTILSRATYLSRLESDVDTLLSFYTSGLISDSLMEITTKVVSTILVEASKLEKPIVQDIVSAYEDMSDCDEKVMLSCIVASAVPEKLERSIFLVTQYFSNKQSQNSVQILRLVRFLVQDVRIHSADTDTLKRVIEMFLVDPEVESRFASECFAILTQFKPSVEDVRCLTVVYMTKGLKGVDDCFEQSLDLLDQHQFRALFRQVVACAFQLKTVHCFRAIRSFGIALGKAKYAETADIVAASLMDFSKEFHFIEIDGIIEYFQFLERLLREGPKAISQFSLEMTLSLGRKILQAEVQDIDASPQQSEALFLSLLRVISSILLYHRHRISGRHHLISGIFVELLKAVTLPVPGRPVCASWIQQYTSDENLIPRARGLERLVSNLCEPPSHAVRDRAGMSRLSSAKAAVSRVLSKHLPLLLVAYVDTSLNYGFPASVKDIVRVAFYPVFDILGPEGVANAGAFLDSSGRAYLRPAYEDYKRNGKWQD